MSDAVQILDLPIKNEPMDDDNSSVFTANEEEEENPLDYIVLKEIKPYTQELGQRVGKVEREHSVTAKKADKALAAIEYIVKDFDVKDFESLKLRLGILEAGARTPWNRKDDDGKAAQPSSTNNELKRKLEQHDLFFLQIATALNEHSQKIPLIEQVVARHGTILQPAEDTSLSETVKQLDNKEQVASERIAMLEERCDTLAEQLLEVFSILGHEPMLPGHGEPTDLITHRVASLEKQSSQCITAITETTARVGKLSLAQTMSGSTAVDTSINTDVAVAFNTRMDKQDLRLDRLERSKAINDTTPLRGARQHPNNRGRFEAGRRGFDARGGKSNRGRPQEMRNDWTPHPKVPIVNDSQLIDDTESSVNVQPRPASFQVDEVQLSQEEKEQKAIFHKQMNEVSRMYQKAELVQKKREIDLAMSRTAPFYEVHALRTEQLEALLEKVNQRLSEFSPIPPEPWVENTAPWG